MSVKEIAKELVEEAAKSYTLVTARQKLKPLNMSIQHIDGEYRVNFKGGSESTAYYTNSISDAVATAEEMCGEKYRPRRRNTETAAPKYGKDLAQSTVDKRSQEIIKDIQKVLKQAGFTYKRSLQSAMFWMEFTHKDGRRVDLEGWHNTGKWKNGGVMLLGCRSRRDKKTVSELNYPISDAIDYVGQQGYFVTEQYKRKYEEFAEDVYKAVREFAKD